MIVQRPNIDQDPVRPWVWASLICRDDPVEVLSYPIPHKDDGPNITDRATIMVRMRVGEPGTLREVPFRAVACFEPSRHEWFYRPKKFYDEGINAFVFTDE